MSNKKLTHVTETGAARMVDISDKKITERTAVASARVLISNALLKALKENSLAKGDALAVARVAGIMAAKKTDQLIPLCHTLPLSSIEIDIKLKDTPPSVLITTTAKSDYKTGVEMEALTAASVAALTIYDMGKSIDKGIVIEKVQLESKRGGKSGDWIRKAAR
jgi:cyclic pyranopterin monophosphate synthase